MKRNSESGMGSVAIIAIVLVVLIGIVGVMAVGVYTARQSYDKQAPVRAEPPAMVDDRYPMPPRPDQPHAKEITAALSVVNSFYAEYFAAVKAKDEAKQKRLLSLEGGYFASELLAYPPVGGTTNRIVCDAKDFSSFKITGYSVDGDASSVHPHGDVLNAAGKRTGVVNVTVRISDNKIENFSCASIWPR